MSRDSNIRSSLFPHMPRGGQIADDKGNLTEHWGLSLMNVYQTLQKTFRSSGFMVPRVTESDINDIQSKYTPYLGKLLPRTLEDISGMDVFDSTNRLRKVFIITYNANSTVNTAEWKTYTLT